MLVPRLVLSLHTSTARERWIELLARVCWDLRRLGLEELQLLIILWDKDKGLKIKGGRDFRSWIVSRGLESCMPSIGETRCLYATARLCRSIGLTCCFLARSASLAEQAGFGPLGSDSSRKSDGGSALRTLMVLLTSRGDHDHDRGSSTLELKDTH